MKIKLILQPYGGECYSHECVLMVPFWCWWKLTLRPPPGKWETDIGQASFLCSSSYLSPLVKERWKVSNICSLLFLITQLLSNVTTWWRTAAELLVVIFVNSCLSNLTSRLLQHHTFALLPRPRRLAPLLSQRSKEEGAWGASQHGFEVGRLKRKDLSNWDDGAKVGRGGGSEQGTGKAENTESSGPRGIQLRARLF